MGGTTHISFRIQNDVLEAVDQRADLEHRSRGQMLNRLLSDAIGGDVPKPRKKAIGIRVDREYPEDPHAKYVFTEPAKEPPAHAPTCGCTICQIKRGDQ